MTKNERFLNMLKIMNFEVTDDIASGVVVGYELLEDNKTWRVTLEFDSLLTVERVNSLTSGIKQYLVDEIGALECKFTINYRNSILDGLNNLTICDYFEEAIKVLSTVKREITIIKKYTYEFVADEITINVGTDIEKSVVEALCKLIKKYFNNYGLNEIKLSVEIGKEKTDFKAEHEKQLQILENHNVAVGLENYKRIQLDAQTNKTDTTFTGYYKNKPLEVLIEDIPLTSIEVQEFSQINGTTKVTVNGVLVKGEIKNLKSKKTGKELHLYTGVITNYKDSVTFKRFFKEEDSEIFEKDLKPGKNIELTGSIEWDDYAKSVVIMCNSLVIKGVDSYRVRFDGQPEKRVELHAHTKMSVLDSILNVGEYVEQASRYGHSAIAVTDHENCHVFPDFFKACKKNNIKPIAGLEANYIDIDDIKIALTNEDINLNDATFVVFDIETTGFCINFNEIIEIGGVKIKNGMIIDSFSEFVKPNKRITEYITNLTDISNDTVFDALTIEEVLPEFKKFIEGCVLVAHNAKFDTDYIYANMKKLGIFEHEYPCIDTIIIARSIYPERGLKRFNLGAVAKFLKVEIEQQHRAIHDAKTTTNVFMKMLGDIAELGISNYKDLNKLVDPNQIYKHVIPTHINMLVKTHAGLKNLYKIISDSHTNHFWRNARVVRSVLEQYREGLLIGSGCVNGEVFRAALEKTEDILRERIRKYDYIEIQPPSSYMFLFEKTADLGAKEYVLDTIKLLIRVAKEEGKIVVATGDVHELIPEDSEFRKIYLSVARPNGGGPHELSSYDSTIDMHFRTTTEMLNEFSFLGTDLAYEIVVTNTNLINNMIESYDLFPKQLFVPRDDFRAEYGVPSMKQAIYDICDQTAHEKYGPNIPVYVKERLDRELKAIIGHGYFSVYYISHLLVKDSNENGYVVGSRGSVGSSFAATMMKITEVNPLTPHYVCPHCYFNAFKFTEEEKQKYGQTNIPAHIEEALNSVSNGFDLPNYDCPICGHKMNRDGMSIAFETFLGFTGEKVPDIDLNFSGDYQGQAHLFAQRMFGKDYAFRAGTCSTVMDKTAFAYVRDYYNDKGIIKRQSEIDRLASFIAGSKRTTGQHPGGIVVVPDNIEIYDVTPIQFPPVSDKDDLTQMQWRTSHFDYHSFEDNLLKLDILGHDDPTLIKKLIEYVQARPDEFPFDTVEGIPFIDEDVISLFSSKDALKIKGDDLDTLSSGTIGMPEFGTRFVRGMLETIKPNSYNDIIKVSGLSHGTDVWAGNAEALVKGLIDGFPKVEFKDVIGCRDDIMIYLIAKGVPAADSFKIMESVRKGRGITKDQENLMIQNNVPDWFVWTCKKIKYLFPKAHATAYVIMALRIGWFKVHRPIYYYAVYFSVRAKEYDAEIFALGKNAIRNKIQEIEKKIQNHDVTNKEENLLDELRIALEMVLRGYTFKQIDINKSLATDFVISDDRMSLYLPFVTIPSLGEAVAKSIVEARETRPFSSKKDVERRTSINKTQFAKLQLLGVFDELPDDDETTLF